MPEKPSKSNLQLDNELADFTDRILSDQSPDAAPIDPSDELQALKNTVLRLKATIKHAPDEVTMQQIEKKLVNEWHKNQGSVEKKPAIWKQLLSGSAFLSNQAWRGPALAFLLLVFFLIIALPFSQLIAPNIQATAGTTGQYQIVLFIVAVVLVIGLLWFSRDKNR